MRKLAICITLTGATFSSLASADYFHQGSSALSCVDTQDANPQIYYTSNGAAHNDSTTAETFVCPIPWTNIADDDTGLGMSTWDISWNVTLVDSNSGATASCFVRACQRDGTDCIQTDDVESTNGTQFFTGDMLSLEIGHTYAFLSCSIPGKPSGGARSGVASYAYFLIP